MEIPRNITNVLHAFLNGSHDNTLGFDDSLPEKAVKTMAYCILVFVSLTGNTLIIWAIYRDQRLRTNTNILVANMAVSDLLCSLVIAPYAVVLVSFNRWLIDGDFGLALCKVTEFLSNVSMTVSVYSCIFIAIERYYAVAHPFKGGFSRSRLKYIIPGIWIFATVINSYVLYNKILVKKGDSIHCTMDFFHVGIKVSFIAFFLLVNAIPVSVIAILYLLIVYKLRQRKVPGQSLDSVRMRREQQNKKVLKMAVAITSLLFFSWLLFDINWFLFLSGKYSHLPEFVGLFLVHSTVTYNFFICLIFNDIYQHNFKFIFSRAFKCPNLSIKINRRIESMPQEVGIPKAELELLSVTLQAK